MVKVRHTKYYERRMRSNKVEYSTSAGLYCTAHDVKVDFCMPDFSSSKIIEHHFHVNNKNGELGIDYDMMTGRDMMVDLILSTNFKNQVLQ